MTVSTDELGPAAPTPPIAIAGGAAQAQARLDTKHVPVDGALLSRLSDACGQVTTASDAIGEASRDWWPLAMTWALEGQVAQLAAAITTPTTVDEVQAVLRICNEVAVPLTAAAGRSGVFRAWLSTVSTSPNSIR